ncbi:hypothetical protein BMS3Abin08_00025 [bacterium BMS3Abin08]|nr:hypothetical protein BMS3Abin08_00025 [bacterium BMS3Abin08]
MFKCCLFLIINITPSGLCRSSIFPSFHISVIPYFCHSIFLSFRLVRNLSSRKYAEQVEGFPTSGNDTENKDTSFRHPAVSAAIPCFRHSIFPSFRLVRNLSSRKYAEQVEGFPTNGNDTENKDTSFRHPAVSATGWFTCVVLSSFASA